MKNFVRIAALTAVAFAVALTSTPATAQPADEGVCIQVITYASAPQPGSECEAFPTPCDVPPGYKSCDPEAVAMQGGDPCIQVITYARSPQPGSECQAFPTPCDVPNGWTICDGETVDMQAADEGVCIQVITYARAPQPGSECQAFPTPCDVPNGYKSCTP